MDKSIDLGLKLLTPLLAVAAFVWGIYTYREAQFQQAETRRIEATRPYLDKQLALYIEATQATATIATSGGAAEVTGRVRVVHAEVQPVGAGAVRPADGGRDDAKEAGGRGPGPEAVGAVLGDAPGRRPVAGRGGAGGVGE